MTWSSTTGSIRTRLLSSTKRLRLISSERQRLRSTRSGPATACRSSSCSTSVRWNRARTWCGCWKRSPAAGRRARSASGSGRGKGCYMKGSFAAGRAQTGTGGHTARMGARRGPPRASTRRDPVRDAIGLRRIRLARTEAMAWVHRLYAAHRPLPELGGDAASLLRSAEMEELASQLEHVWKVNPAPPDVRCPVLQSSRFSWTAPPNRRGRLREVAALTTLDTGC